MSASPSFLAASPLRDARFDVRDRWDECARFPAGDPQKTQEFLHRQMNEEIDALECSARSISDFPDAPWEIRMFLARQCSDEARHAWLFRDLFQRRGGKIGQFPVMNFQYRIICGFETLVERLAVQNRTFEAEGIDAIDSGVDDAKAKGDDELAALFDAQFADEIQHVRMANEHIQEAVRREPRLVMGIARALARAMEVFGQVFGDKGAAVDKYLPSEQGRSEAGFSKQEIDVAMRLAEERRQRIRSAAS